MQWGVEILLVASCYEPGESSGLIGDLARMLTFFYFKRLLTSFCSQCTALIAAATQGRVGVLRLLLDRGANLRLMTTNGKNCLESAISNGHHDVCMEIIKHDRYIGQSQTNILLMYHVFPINSQ